MHETSTKYLCFIYHLIVGRPASKNLDMWDYKLGVYYLIDIFGSELLKFSTSNTIKIFNGHKEK